ncbi:hypothetical protein [Brevibacterium sp.]|uniref:hypothetical protein n=1 Tax=Brevibacterium sp. TaxID=1701 RepID=UPI00281257D2|nr:hypothetical protein [Brevibacterium sp.]
MDGYRGGRIIALIAVVATTALLLVSAGFFGARLIFGGEATARTAPVGLETPSDAAAQGWQC